MFNLKWSTGLWKIWPIWLTNFIFFCCGRMQVNMESLYHVGVEQQLSSLHADLVDVWLWCTEGQNGLVEKQLQRPSLPTLVYTHSLTTHAQPQLSRIHTIYTLTNRENLFSDIALLMDHVYECVCVCSPPHQTGLIHIPATPWQDSCIFSWLVPVPSSAVCAIFPPNNFSNPPSHLAATPLWLQAPLLVSVAPVTLASSASACLPENYPFFFLWMAWQMQSTVRIAVLEHAGGP